MRTPSPPVFHHDRIGSTSDEAKRLAASGAAHRTVVVAKEQTGGRGRRARPWQSPPGNLYLSIIFRPAVPPFRVAELGFVAAVALAETIAALLPDERAAALKWPNDLLVDGAKIAGILLESEVARDAIDWAVLGLGLNVAHAPEGTPYQAAALRAMGAAETLTAEAILPGLLAALDRWYDRWLAEGFAPVAAAWTARAFRADEPMQVRLGERVIAGRFIGLGPHGELRLRTEAGEQTVSAGEVAFG